MQAPVDYPITEPALNSRLSIEELSYAALLDRADTEKPVTEEMIHTARLGIELAQDVPAAHKAAAKPYSAIIRTLQNNKADQSSLLSRWVRVIR